MRPFLLLTLILVTLAGCGIFKAPPNSQDSRFFTSYRDIPGVTDAEIKAIKAIRERGEPLIYGGLPGTEAFMGEDGEIKGYMALFCEFLTTLFDIHFEPRFYEWDDLIAGLESEEIAFTGELTANDERRKVYFMTDPIALRSVKHFRLINSRPLMEIAADRPLRFAFLDGTVTGDDVRAASKDSIEMFFVDNYDEAYELLKNRTIDAFFEESTAEYVFDEYPDIVARLFFPLLFSDVSLTTRTPELEPIISVVQKMLINGGDMYLAKLYGIGHQTYMQNKFSKLLSEEEREYMQSRTTVSLLTEYDNYPMSFYNVKEKQWQGIALDVIRQLETMTGLSFQVINGYNTEWSDLLAMLESGKGSIITELIRTQEREGRFHWPTTAITHDYYALLSKSNFKDVNYNEFFYMTVGVARGTAYDEMFRRWFPNHLRVVEYDCTDELFEALRRGEIDLVMSSRNQLLYMTNYREYVDYKINFLFDLPFESTFGFHIADSLLCSIVDKALRLIDTDRISGYWTRKTFDYRAKIAEERYLFFFGIGSLIVCIFSLAYVLMGKKRNEKRLEHEVLARTSELEKSHIELKEAVQIAESANRAKSSFLATMSHEIRTPMNAVMGISQIQLQKDGISKDCEDAFEKIYSSSNSLLRIVNDILDQSKIEAGKLELIIAEYGIANLINDATLINIVKIGSKPIEFITEVDDNMPSKFIGDELRIKQVLNNLLSNAMKYTDKGSVCFTINHETRDDGTTLLRFIIKDTGQGMTPEDLARLFSEYQRFNVSSNYATEGTGLGLSIAKRLITLMDGKIEVDSVYGEGSTFTIEIVQKNTQCEPIGRKTAVALKNYSYSQGKEKRRGVRHIMPYGKILVVDDVNTNLYVAVGLLHPYKLIVKTVTSGFDAIDLVKAGNTYDIIFMDHMMPKMDGIETTQKLREIGYEGTIVALTANALIGSKEMFLSKNFDGFISKPIDIRRLDAALNQFVRDKHPEEAQIYEKQTEEIELPTTATIGPKLLAVFCREAKNAVTTLRETLSNGDMKLYTITAHAMKAALANVGQHDVSEQAFALEKAGKAGDTEFVSANSEIFVKTLEELAENLKPADEDSAGATLAVNDAEISEDTAYLAEMLDTVKTACEEYQIQTAYQALDELKKKTWKKETFDALESIREKLFLESDFDGAAELAEKLRGQ
ncbi:MAG: transporter substrate-binding domain-containing protein [Chitinispirillales bacterium]|nr:transporter substrate-binding domain-containing protein [Chitinispirillales bacterium]